jgi:uncharacterized membrane protein
VSEVVGGPAGRRLGPGSSWWTPVRVIVVLTIVAACLGLAQKQPCRGVAWAKAEPHQYVHLCYSDIPLLFGPRHIADGEIPYLADVPEDEQVEYPVLTGAMMWLTSGPFGGPNDDEHRRRYFDVNLVLLALCAVVAAVATARTVRRRPWDGAFVALAPGIVVAGTINWDLLAVALTAVAGWAWARERVALAGLLIGLGTAAKFYPLLLLGPLLVLCLRAGRMREWWTTVATAAGAWLVVNVPVMLANFEGWLRFYRLSRERGAGFGSPWYSLSLAGHAVPDARLNAVAGGAFVLCCAAIGALGLFARRRPRVAQLSFLVVAAFLLTNKVYSPQYVVWLVPLAALARPKWRDFLIWQAAEVVHWAGTWLYLVSFTQAGADRALSATGYNWVVLAHIVGTLWFAALVVRDVLSPRHDVVRADGSDDPGGGVLDEAPDVMARER